MLELESVFLGRNDCLDKILEYPNLSALSVDSVPQKTALVQVNSMLFLVNSKLNELKDELAEKLNALLT